ncbi:MULTISPECIES: alpha/beta fold hydrolase [unclassified Bradyrhizobium]|uniref:alpha/beta fold hydrolase n=1 Tax=unclassified Bradyrhizobium TaxID=2631580 RepID=UPI0028E58744|nr:MULTISPECIES: alpha/beta fold hydrolase [unclassified Bradyrhizobium]
MTFILIPGAWLGEWCWREVTRRLDEAGWQSIAITLPGLGERANLLNPDIGLDAHVSDVVSLLSDRALRNVTLVGHSYGGTVISAVAEQLPDRVSCLVFLDASIPQDGQSNNDVLGSEWADRIRATARETGDGWRVPPPSSLDVPDDINIWAAQKLTPHPLRSFEDPVRLRSPTAARIRRVFLRSSTHVPLYDRLMERARAAGWQCGDVPGGHYSMLTAPQAVAEAFGALMT